MSRMHRTDTHTDISVATHPGATGLPGIASLAPGCAPDQVSRSRT